MATSIVVFLNEVTRQLVLNFEPINKYIYINVIREGNKVAMIKLQVTKRSFVLVKFVKDFVS